MNFEDFLSSLDVWNVDVNLSVESSGAHKSGIENIRAVGRRHNDNRTACLEAVHLDEKLVEGLFSFVVAAAQTRAALTAHCVDFIDEDNARHILLRLLEQVSHARRAYAYEHFHEVRTAYREERHVCLARNRLCKKRFARARRSDEKNAARNARAHIRIFFWMFEKIHDFLQFLLFFLCARNVAESDFYVAHLIGFCLAEIERLSLHACALSQHDHKYAEKRGVKNERNENAGKKRTAGRVVVSYGYAVK